MCWCTVVTRGKKNCKPDQVPSLRKHITSSWPTHLIRVSICGTLSVIRACESVDSVSSPQLTLTVWVTCSLRIFTGSACVWDNYVFSTGGGLMQSDWIGFSDTVCDLSRASVDGKGQWHRLFLAGKELAHQTNGMNKGVTETTRSFHLSIIATLWHSQSALTGKNTHTYEFACCVYLQGSLDY